MVHPLTTWAGDACKLPPQRQEASQGVGGVIGGAGGGAVGGAVGGAGGGRGVMMQTTIMWLVPNQEPRSVLYATVYGTGYQLGLPAYPRFSGRHGPALPSASVSWATVRPETSLVLKCQMPYVLEGSSGTS